MNRIIGIFVALLLSLMPAVAQQAQLSWTASTDNVAVTSYNIYRDGVKVGTSPTNSYTDTGLRPLTKYVYTVAAVDAAGNESPLSVAINVTTLAATTPPDTGTTFVPLHTYFVAPSGCNDANPGTAASPWCTPNHAVVCGDVIVAAPGSYTNGQFSGKFGKVTNCPSTTGGIDGSGGIWFAVLLCGGDLTTCNISGGNANVQVDKGSSNWAVEGFTIPNDTAHRAMTVRTVGSCSELYNSHHVAFVNNVIYGSLQAIGVNDGGCALGSIPPATDYLAAVGNIAQNSVLDNICLGAIDYVGTGATDAVTTAVKGYIAGNFAWSNRNTSCDRLYDNEGIMLDTLDAHNSNGIWTVENNIMWDNGRYGFQLFWQCHSKTPFVVNILNNTAFGNNAGSVTAGSLSGEINISANDSCVSYNPIPVTVNIFGNIGKSRWATSPGSGISALYAEAIVTHNSGANTLWSHWGLLTNGKAGKENVWDGQRTSCTIFNNQGGCDAGNNIDWTDSVSRLGTNLYVDPAFANETDLLANRLGAPNCTGFETVTQCMGWNAETGKLTTPSVIADLTPTAAGTTGKGYQKPSASCKPNENFPVWLKGIVHLHWDGTKVQRKAGLVDVPCGM